MVPYDRCTRWRLHEEYFATRGLAPWREGEVPHQATNTYAFARSHAAFFLERTAELATEGRLPAPEPLTVLEVGGGIGRFAAHFLGALGDRGEDGRGLLARLTYHYSDVSPKTVSEAASQPELAPWVRAGRLVPLVLDARRPRSPRTLDGNPAVVDPPLAVVANYLCCVLPTKLLRRRGGLWHELHGTPGPAPEGLPAPSPGRPWQRILGEHEWRPLALEEILEKPVHRLALERALPGPGDADLAYPYGFLDLLDALAGGLRPGGVLLFSDFGDDSYEEGIGPADRLPIVYGESLAQPVCFPTIRAFAALRGWSLLESDGRHGATRTFAVTRGPASAALGRAFECSGLRANAGQDLLDFASAAKALGRAGESAAALRFYDRCLGLSPRDPLLYLRAGEECLAAGRYASAVEYFRRGAAVDAAGEYDFECRMGEAWCWTGEPRKALSALRVSARREPRPVTYVLLGDAYAAVGEHQRARRAYLRALAAEPAQAAALEGLRLLDPSRSLRSPPAAEGAGDAAPTGPALGGERKPNGRPRRYATGSPRRTSHSS